VRRSKANLFIVSLTLVISLIFVLGTGSTVQAGSKTLKVGMLMPLSGPISIVGVGLSRAVELYFDKINEEGGLKIGGESYTLKLMVEDSKHDPTVAATATKKLVYKDGCKFVFGASKLEQLSWLKLLQ